MLLLLLFFITSVIVLAVSLFRMNRDLETRNLYCVLSICAIVTAIASIFFFFLITGKTVSEPDFIGGGEGFGPLAPELLPAQFS